MWPDTFPQTTEELFWFAVRSRASVILELQSSKELAELYAWAAAWAKDNEYRSVNLENDLHWYLGLEELIGEQHGHQQTQCH